MEWAAEPRIAEHGPITEQQLEISARRCFHSTAESEASSSTSLTHPRLWRYVEIGVSNAVTPPQSYAKIRRVTSMLSNASHVSDY